ncbi:MAG TPA: tetratricopeptide repeat protein [candidate division Zixibacteria bacterium]|nr:tetratricopeptide repeat protein [candidate division Zixibacteria bacterium]
MRFARYLVLTGALLWVLPAAVLAQDGGDLPAEEQAKQHFNAALEYSKDPSKVTEMVSEYLLCLKKDPNFVDAYINLGVHYFGKKDYAEAEKNFKKAAELAPSDTTVFDNLGKTYVVLRKYADAEKAFSSGITANAAYLSGHKQLGDIFYKQQKYKESIAALEKYTTAASDDHTAFYTLGKAYEKVGDDTKALAAYKKTVQIDPNYVNAHNALGQMYLSQEKFSLAISSYRKSIQLNPKGYRAYYNLAIAVQSSDPENYDASLQAWRDAYKACKNVPKAKDLASQAQELIAELEKVKKEASLGG